MQYIANTLDESAAYFAAKRWAEDWNEDQRLAEGFDRSPGEGQEDTDERD